MDEPRNNLDSLKAALADRYAIETEIGSGGMATVYLAKDLRHERKVAVKVLKPELAAVVGTERFLAEIKTTARLSHPLILPLHDSGEAGGFLFFVMPYLEEDSLRERLDRESQLPVDEAVDIARKVADALDHAHRQGVIHRDLKPGNILFQDGEPVVADFGIALAVSAAGEGRLTETGLSLGTPYYTSPEQAIGEDSLTAAADVYSLGCVLYEMLTGEPPHTGTSAQAILGRILLGEVTRPTKIRRTIPAHVEGVILKALERLPADRFRSAAEMSGALEDRAFRYGPDAAAAVQVSSARWRRLAMSFAALAALLLIILLWVALWPDSPEGQVMQQEIVLPGDGPVNQWARFVALAPDGGSMIYRDTVGLESGWQLWLKERGSLEGRPLPGTTGAKGVVFSPDGNSIAYQVEGDLVRYPLHGGSASTVLRDLGSLHSTISWLEDGTILSDQGAHDLVRIHEERGAIPDTVTALSGTPGGTLLWVEGLPGDRAALLVTCSWGFCPSGGVLSVQDLETGTRQFLLDGVMKAWYVPSGEIVWVSVEGEVFAASFDLGNLEMGEARRPLFAGVRVDGSGADMVVAKDGTVLFLSATGNAVESGQVMWVARDGRAEPVDPSWAPAGFHSLALSPDGRRLAVSINAGENEYSIWVKHLPDGPLTQLTTHGGSAIYPTWTSDGTAIGYASNEPGHWQIRTTASDGRSVGMYEVLLDLAPEFGITESEFTPDGQGLVLRVWDAETTDPDHDLGYLNLQDGSVREDFLATDFQEQGFALSPDTRWIAYGSNSVGGRYELFVRSFPRVDSLFTQVSRNGGIAPVWAEDGRELFFQDADGWLISATVSPESDLSVEGQTRLFDARPFRVLFNGRAYDYSPSEDRFIMISRNLRGESADGSEEPRMVQILNWFTELEGGD